MTTQDGGALEAAVASVRLHADWVWWPHMPDQFLRKSAALWAEHCRLSADLAPPRSVRGVIPASRLARYGDYLYDGDDDLSSSAAAEPLATRDDDDAQPWAWVAVDRLFRRLAEPCLCSSKPAVTFSPPVSSQAIAIVECEDADTETAGSCPQAESDALQHMKEELQSTSTLEIWDPPAPESDTLQHMEDELQSTNTLDMWSQPAPESVTIRDPWPVRAAAKPFFPSYQSLGSHRELFPYLRETVVDGVMPEACSSVADCDVENDLGRLAHCFHLTSSVLQTTTDICQGDSPPSWPVILAHCNSTTNYAKGKASNRDESFPGLPEAWRSCPEDQHCNLDEMAAVLDGSPRRLYRDVLASRPPAPLDNAYDELEHQALEQYHQLQLSYSDASIEDRFQELEKQAIEQYQCGDGSECACGGGCMGGGCWGQQQQEHLHAHRSMSSEDDRVAS